ncbi:MAG: hypothetical protein ACYTFA_03965 [Planctomycetota bacterium]|jgi:membrane protein implicated in regulation of membrane protease activity
MSDQILMNLAEITPLLTTVYWVCLIVGGGLLLISTLAGGHADADVGGHVGGDMSFDGDVGADFHGAGDLSADVHAPGDVSGDIHAGHAGATSLASWFSMQFVVYFMAMFGLIGATFTHLTDTGVGVTLALAAAGGIIVGQGVHQLLRKLRRTSGNSTTQLTDYVNKTARVTIDMTHQNKGEVALQVRGTERFLPAVSKREDAEFLRGDTVTVVEYQGGMARVVSREEFEFLTNKD